MTSFLVTANSAGKKPQSLDDNDNTHLLQARLRYPNRNYVAGKTYEYRAQFH